MFPRDIVFLRNISINTLHKGDDDDDDDDDNNNNLHTESKASNAKPELTDIKTGTTTTKEN